jgi:integrase
MATIRQIPSGYWQGIIRKKGYSQLSRTFSTKRDCERWATDTEAKMNRGLFNDVSESEALTLRDGLKRYLLEVTPNKKGAESEEYKINAILREGFVQKTFATFRLSDAAKYRDELVKVGLSASTIRKNLSLLSHLYETANREWGVSCINPIKTISKPKVSNSRKRRLSALEHKYLIASLANTGAGVRQNSVVLDVVLFAIETAMRQSEILALNWADIDFDERSALLNDTKNGESREVPLSSIAIKILAGDSGNVTKIRRGKVFKTTSSAVKQSYMRAVIRARKAYEADFGKDEWDDKVLVNLTFHDLRHEATSRLAEVFEMHELMKVTGHKDSRMLARYYHPKMSDLAKKLA